MAMFKRDDKLPKGVGYTAGGVLGALKGKSIGSKLVDPSKLAKGLQTFRQTGNAIPTLLAKGKKTIPMVLLLGALGALSGGKLQDLSGK